jgi:NAD(P)H-flavin reductase
MTAPMITPTAYAPGALAKIANETPMVPRPFRITDLTWETGAGDVYTWKLEPVDGGEFKFKPGQFNMLYHYGVGEVPISISGDSESGVLIHTSRAVGAVTQAMQKLRPGDEIGVRGPFGSDWPVELAQGKELILLSGGIGLAPLRPVVYYALNNINKFNKLNLIYGTRTPLDILYRRELEQWQLEGQINVAMTVDRASGHWQGNVGVVTNLLEHINIDAKNSMAMVCGPEVMMHFGSLALQKAGLSQEQIYISMERNMKCAIGHCGHCQWGPHFICKDGPVFRLDYIDNIFEVREL